jgi:hypothetical protein
MLQTVVDFLEHHGTSLEKVIFCLWSREDLDVFENALGSLLPGG